MAWLVLARPDVAGLGLATQGKEISTNQEDTMSITMTLDRRPRTSDGTAVCSACGEIIPDGETYISESGSDGGILVEFDTCMHCKERGENSDAASWLFVVAVTLGSIALLCLAVR